MDKQNRYRVSIVYMDRRPSHTPKNVKRDRRIHSYTVFPSSFFSFSLVFLLVATTTFVVRATTFIDTEEYIADTLVEDDDSGVLKENQQRNVLFSSHYMNGNEEIVIDSIINTEDDSKITEDTKGDVRNETADFAFDQKDDHIETKSVQKTAPFEAEHGIVTSSRENGTSDSSSPSFAGKVSTLKVESGDSEFDTEKSTNDEASEEKDEEPGKHASAENETNDFVQTDSFIENVYSTQQQKMNEKRPPSIDPSSFTVFSEVENSEQLKMEIASASEKTTKLRPVRIEKKKEMEGDAHSPLAKGSIQRSNRSSKNNMDAEEIQKKTMMENDVLEKPIQSQDRTKLEEGDREGEKPMESLKNSATSSNATLSDGQRDTKQDIDTKDQIALTIPTETDEVPISDDNSDSIVDLGIDSIGSEARPTWRKEETAFEQDEKHIYSNDNGLEATKNEDYKLDHRGEYISDAVIYNKNKNSVMSGIDDEIQSPVRLDHRSNDATNNTATEVPSTTATCSYHGEPWGRYRSTRRLPDLELLRLVFENVNKTGKIRSSGDIESQKVVNRWQKDPLYDHNMAKDAEGGKPLLIEDQDKAFLDYRSRLLNDRGGGGNQNSNIKSSDKQSEENIHNEELNENNDNSNNADVNSEFIEGLDDIANFFEGVDPPDELDVGYGSSIQDVLMDKGKHILLKKVRGLAEWMQNSWQNLGRKIEERISRFQLPFQQIQRKTNTKPVVNSEAMNLSGALASFREAISSVFKTGKQTFELISDLIDGLLDRFDSRLENDSTEFDDFNGFDLDELSTFPPQP